MKKLKNFEKKWLTNSDGCVILLKLLLSNTDRESKNFWKKCLTNETKFAKIAMFRRKAACTL